MSGSPTRGTAGYVIYEAMFEAGKLGRGSEPKSEDYAIWLNRLCDMATQWCTQGIKLFTWQDYELVLTAGQALYTIGASVTNDLVIPLPMKILQSYYIDLTGNQRPLEPLSWDDWTRLSNKTQNSAPNSYFVDRQEDILNFWIWLSPDVFTAANGTVHTVIQNRVDNPTSITDRTGFPPEWWLALIWGLADEKSGGSPIPVQQRCQQRAMYYKEQLENFDVEEASTQITPDSRGGYFSRFV